ncbi:MAG: hypothetical protein WCR67_00450 [Bacilli bacterium]
MKNIFNKEYGRQFLNEGLFERCSAQQLSWVVLSYELLVTNILIFGVFAQQIPMGYWFVDEFPAKIWSYIILFFMIMAVVSLGMIIYTQIRYKPFKSWLMPIIFIGVNLLFAGAFTLCSYFTCKYVPSPDGYYGVETELIPAICLTVVYIIINFVIFYNVYLKQICHNLKERYKKA